MNFFRNLKPDEVELKPCFIDSKNFFVQLLIYKTARTDFNILDEKYGLNWKSSFKEVNGVVYCTLSVLNDGEWISREDCGDNGNELCPEKSQASSAIKRAGAQLGIGRELYNAPDIKINLNREELSEDGKKLKTKFKVTSMTISPEGKFTELTVTDNKGNTRYTYPKTLFRMSQNKTADSQEEEPSQDIDSKELRKEALEAFCKGLVDSGANRQIVSKFYRFYISPSKDNENQTVAEAIQHWNPDRLWQKWLERERN